MVKLVIPDTVMNTQSFGQALKEIYLATLGYIPDWFNEYYTEERLAEEAKQAKEFYENTYKPFLESAGKALARHKEQLVFEAIKNGDLCTSCDAPILHDEPHTECDECRSK